VIVQIRGTSGAGKSTLVQRLLREHGGEFSTEPLATDDGAEVELPVWHCEGDLCVIGRYPNLTGVSRGVGGAVVVGPIGETILARYGRRHAHLVWENYRGSTELPQGRGLERAKELGLVWATLDTPVEECLARIRRRRSERQANVGAPLNEGAIRAHHRQVEALSARAARQGIRCVTLAHADAYEQLHALLLAGGVECRHATIPRGDVQA
jgi:predicted kinase